MAATIGVTALSSLAVQGVPAPASAVVGTELWLLKTAGAQSAVDPAVRNAVVSQT